MYISIRRQSSLRCGGREHSELNTKCYSGEDWTNVSLEEFINCDSNLAWNRQTRMLADLTQIGCYQNIFNLTVNELDRFKIYKFLYFCSLKSGLPRRRRPRRSGSVDPSFPSL